MSKSPVLYISDMKYYFESVDELCEYLKEDRKKKLDVLAQLIQDNPDDLSLLAKLIKLNPSKEELFALVGMQLHNGLLLVQKS